MWNGTRPILNPNPAINKPTDNKASGTILESSAAYPLMTSPMLVEPVRP